MLTQPPLTCLSFSRVNLFMLLFPMHNYLKARKLPNDDLLRGITSTMHKISQTDKWNHMIGLALDTIFMLM